VQDPDGGGVTFFEVIPALPAGGNVIVRYLPNAPTLANDGDDFFDGFGGWEQYVVVDAAMKVCEREDLTEKKARLELDKEKLIARIQKLAGKRDQGRAASLTDIRTIRAFGRIGRRFLG